MNITKLFCLGSPKLKPVRDPDTANAAKAVMDDIHRTCDKLRRQGKEGKFQRRFSSDCHSSQIWSQGSSTHTDFSWDKSSGLPIRLDHHDGFYSHLDPLAPPVSQPQPGVRRDYECHLHREGDSTIYSRRIYDSRQQGFAHFTESVRATPGQPLEYGIRQHLDSQVMTFLCTSPLVPKIALVAGTTAAVAGLVMAAGGALGTAGAVGGICGAGMFAIQTDLL